LSGSPLILRTADGGDHWTTVISPATDILQGVFFPSPSIGYIVGWNGDILKTVDGGITWSMQTSVANYGNLDVFFVDNTTGYIVGGLAAFAGIQKTTDGGQHWYAQTSSVNQGLIGVFFPTANTGYCVGLSGTILKTTNGGETGMADAYKSGITVNTFPNPAADKITLDFSKASVHNIHIAVYEVSGKVAFQENITVADKEMIDISELGQGMYFLVIDTDQGKLTKKFIKE
jgi:photosystem II stability/assembly factor-like uncharacterized protein